MWGFFGEQAPLAPSLSMGGVIPELTFWDPHYAEGRGGMSVPLNLPPCRAWEAFSKGSHSEYITCFLNSYLLEH